MSRFDEEPERDIHDECRHEIERLTTMTDTLSIKVDNLTAENERITTLAHGQHVELYNARLEIEAIRNQEPLGYIEQHLIAQDRKIILCNLTKTPIWRDMVTVYTAAGAAPKGETK